MRTRPSLDGLAGPCVPAVDVAGVVRELLHFPHPQICRHHVACLLLEVLESSGHSVTPGLARAVVAADDDAAVTQLDALYGGPVGRRRGGEQRRRTPRRAARRPGVDR